MASCRRVAVSGNYLVKQKEEKKGQYSVGSQQLQEPASFKLRWFSLVTLGCLRFSAYPSGLAEETGFGGKAV